MFWHMLKISRGFTFGSLLSASCQDIEIFWRTCKNLVFNLWRQWMLTKFHVRHFTRMSDILLKPKKRQPYGGVRVKAEGKWKKIFQFVLPFIGNPSNSCWYFCQDQLAGSHHHRAMLLQQLQIHIVKKHELTQCFFCFFFLSTCKIKLFVSSLIIV